MSYAIKELWHIDEHSCDSVAASTIDAETVSNDVNAIHLELIYIQHDIYYVRS